ncbi:MAG: hypothetical protein R3F14_09515 [Polyangiaceae bacterium]
MEAVLVRAALAAEGDVLGLASLRSSGFHLGEPTPPPPAARLHPASEKPPSRTPARKDRPRKAARG